MLQLIVSGLAAGSAYALVALSLVLVLKATGVANFAQAETGLFAAFIVWSLMTSLQLPYFVAVPIGIVGSVLVGVLMERILIRPIRTESHLSAVIMTIAALTVLNSILALIWGANPQQINSPFDGGFKLFGSTVSYVQVVAIGAGSLVAFGLTRFFKSPQGVRMQAVAEDRVTPRLLGVNMNAVFVLSWGIAGAVSAVGLILLTQGTVLSVGAATSLIIKGFVAAAIGGFTSITGAFVGGLSLGVLENLVGGYVSTSGSSAIALIVILLLLMVKPQGLFGQARAREV
jgi:branched-chain amino acid transport system permease protein